MSCLIMNLEPLAALANAVETRLNCGYNYWGFEAPDSLYRELSDCRIAHSYHSYCVESIYRKLYALNVRAYNGRYKDHEEPVDEEAPVIDGSGYVVHHGPEYREHGFAVRPWHYHLAALLDFWLYQTLEDATRNDPLRLAMQDFRDCLYSFIVRNSPPYTAVRWGELPPYGTGRAQREAVYYINTIPGEAVAQKGHADFPKDFPHLRPGENFTAWRVGYDWEVETTLSGESLLARLKALKDQAAEERTRELQYIISFAEQGCFDTELACNQLRGLWTAYCLHHGLEVDTSVYDGDLQSVWAQVAAVESDTAYWGNYSSFDDFMCVNLV